MARLYVQLAAQDGDAGVVGVQRGRAVVDQRVQTHQQGVGRLVQGVVAQQDAGVGDGAAVLAALLVQRGQLLQCPTVSLGQPLPLGQQPVVVAARQQVAAVEGHGLLQVGQRIGRSSGLGQRPLELGHVQGVGNVRAPLEGGLVNGEQVVQLRHGAAQAVPEAAEVGASLLLAGVGPEEEGQVLAGHRPVALQEQIGQQVLQARVFQVRHPLVARGDAKAA